MAYKRCKICRKKATWRDGDHRFYFCEEHADKWGKYLFPPYGKQRLKEGSGWQKHWQELMQKFLKREAK